MYSLSECLKLNKGLIYLNMLGNEFNFLSVMYLCQSLVDNKESSLVFIKLGHIDFIESENFENFIKN